VLLSGIAQLFHDILKIGILNDLDVCSDVGDSELWPLKVWILVLVMNGERTGVQTYANYLFCKCQLHADLQGLDSSKD
jgi:hypothetical protein